jgi:hypothetical protein
MERSKEDHEENGFTQDTWQRDSRLEEVQELSDHQRFGGIDAHRKDGHAYIDKEATAFGASVAPRGPHEVG